MIYFLFKYVSDLRAVYNNQIMGTTAVRERVRLLQKSPGEAKVIEYFLMHIIRNK